MKTCYVYLDESGTFSAQEQLNVLGGVAVLADENEPADNHLQKIAQAFQATGLAVPSQLHTTACQPARDYVRAQGKSFVHSLCKGGIQLFPVAIVHSRDAFLPDENRLDSRYSNMLRELLMHLCEMHPGVRMEFYVPTRQVYLPIPPQSKSPEAVQLREQIELYRQLQILCQQVQTRDGAFYKVAVMTGQALLNLQRELEAAVGPEGSVRLHFHTIDYDQVPESNRYGYYLADWMCWLIQRWCGREGLQADRLKSVRTAASGLRGMVLLPHGQDSLHYRAGMKALKEPGLSQTYLTALMHLRRMQSPYEALLMERSPLLAAAPHEQSDMLRAANRAIFDHAYKDARYDEALSLNELLIALANQAGIAEDAPCMRWILEDIMCCRQHRGETAESRRLFDLLRLMPMERSDQFRLLNRYVQTLLDEFEYAEALTTVDMTIAAVEQDMNRTSLLPMLSQPVSPELMREYAKCLSTRGQILAFMGEYDKAGASFEKALELLQTDPPNRRITLSHYLHCLGEWWSLDASAAPKLMPLASEYFGTPETASASPDDPAVWRSWLDAVHQEHAAAGADASIRFVLWCYLALLRACSRNGSLTSDEIAQLLFADDRLDRLAVSLGDTAHPMELIDKHLMLLAQHCGDGKRAALYRDRISAMHDSSRGTVRIICQLALFQHAIASDDIDTACRMYDALLETLQEMRSAQNGGEDSALARLTRFVETETDYEKVASILTYEFN
ncbi:MAG: tetratricopeptide repeat protein [Clostridia bacterium]|nr:tetratricopeptide repeat protein [Clostridia bacterium]